MRKAKKNDSYELAPNSFIIIKTNEQLNIPTNLVGRVGEKNSVMRLGLKVDAPLYHPGHRTFGFLRVQNLTGNAIQLNKGFKIAQIFFEELKDVPNKPYNKPPAASFNEEDDYKGYGNYSSLYNSLIKGMEKSKSELDNMKSTIYANVLTLMGIMVAIFSLVSVNFSNAITNSISLKQLALVNITLTLCIVVLLGSVVFIVNHSRKNWFTLVYSLIIVALAIAVAFIVF